MSEDRRAYRVIQWATGTIGKYALRSIVDDPKLELAGVWVHSDSKVGKDAGEIAGIDPTGIVATGDVDEILALDADCVHYAPLRSDLDEICLILESGKNVVTPTGYVFLKDPEVVDRLEHSCRKGGVSIHGTGIHPGFAADRLPIVLSALCGKIDKITVYEVADFSQMGESPEMVFGLLGFGMTADEAHKSPPALLEVMSGIFQESMEMIAAGLGFEIESFSTAHEVALATRDVQILAGTIPKGCVAGQHFEYTALIGGVPVIVFQTYWRMDDELEPNWEHTADLRYTVLIEGDPSLKCTLETASSYSGRSVEKVHPAQLGILLATLNGTNSIPAVCDAGPGVRTSLDLPLIRATDVLRGN
ncbi:MAG: dihydrodipicolinate reductase [Deltaproteobacteria bacterium]|nr:dihydrodipicolinate reductase [Deltaproteobacteria bacterium]